jgi:hypothetical protein
MFGKRVGDRKSPTTLLAPLPTRLDLRILHRFCHRISRPESKSVVRRCRRIRSGGPHSERIRAFWIRVGEGWCYRDLTTLIVIQRVQKAEAGQQRGKASRKVEGLCGKLDRGTSTAQPGLEFHADSFQASAAIAQRRVATIGTCCNRGGRRRRHSFHLPPASRRTWRILLYS